MEGSVYHEKELITRLTAGDEGAFKIIFETYHAALYRNVRKLLHADEEVRDVVQEVFLTLWEKRAAINPEGNLGGWLFTLSYNRSVNYLKQKLRREILEQSAETLNADAGAAPEDEDRALFEQQHSLVEAALERLSPQKRRVFELCRLQGKSYEAAAREMGISKHTVNEYLKQAMAAIREYIRDQPPYHSTLAILALEIFFQ